MARPKRLTPEEQIKALLAESASLSAKAKEKADEAKKIREQLDEEKKQKIVDALQGSSISLDDVLQYVEEVKKKEPEKQEAATEPEPVAAGPEPEVFTET